MSVVQVNRGWLCWRLVLSVVGIVGCGDNVGRRLVLSAVGIVCGQLVAVIMLVGGRFCRRLVLLPFGPVRGWHSW